MKKKFRFTIDIVADIPDQLTPEFVNRIVFKVDREHYLSNYLCPTDKSQAFIDYIKNNENIHEACLAGDLFFNLSANAFNEKLTKLLNPKCFDDIALEKSAELDTKTRDFIIRIYEDVEAKNDDAKIDLKGNSLPIRNSKKDPLEALKREIDAEIIQQSLFNYKITAASLKIVKRKPSKDDAKNIDSEK